jgi:putative endopeptidase
LNGVFLPTSRGKLSAVKTFFSGSRKIVSQFTTRKHFNQTQFWSEVFMKGNKSRRVLTLAVIALIGAAAIYGFARASRAETLVPNIPGFDTANLDRSCKPCEDFNKFANGGWMAKNPIPPAYSTWGNFTVLAEKNRENLRKILEAAANAKSSRDSNTQKIGDFYASCMDEQRIETEGLKPIQPELARIEKVSSAKDLPKETAHLHEIGVGVFFGVGARQDLKNSSEVIGSIGQGGLGLPDRDYYLATDENMTKIRNEYVKHVAKMFELMGDDADKAQAEAKAVMDIETALAKASMTRVERREPEAQYHKMTVAELQTIAPNFAWSSYFEDVGARNLPTLNVAQPKFFEALNQLLASTPIDNLKTYMRWHLIETAAPSLSSKFVEENFNFNGRILTGAQEQLPRWKRCVAATDRSLGEALGAVYVKNYFSPEAKQKALTMVNNILAALREDVQTLDWMSDATRQEAIKKFEAFTKKIGYPDKWRNYSGLKIARDNYTLNRFRANEFEFKYRLSKIGKPVDRTEWGMTPPTVNAYYNSSMNEIVFPAGILQPPFFDPNADDAINYGGIGAVIGHEITHGFDDQGAKFDAQGNLRNWFAAKDLENFKERASCVVNQFDSYVVEGNVHEKGKLVVGESIADLGGLKIAYVAYEKSLQGKPRTVIDGFTPEQRFFLGWAQVWAANIRPQYALFLANNDPHPLAKYRVNGPLSNMPEFAAAYGCKAGDPMVRPPSEQCKIW